MIFNRLWALVTSTATISELWMLHPPPKSFSIPLEVYTSYLHVIPHHPTKFRDIPSKIALSSTPFSSQSPSAAATYSYTDPLIAQPSLIRFAWFVYHSTRGDSPLSIDTSLVAIRSPVEEDFIILSHPYSYLSLEHSYLLYLISSSFPIGFYPLHPLSTRPLSLFPIVLPAFLYHRSFHHNNVRIDLTT